MRPAFLISAAVLWLIFGVCSGLLMSEGVPVTIIFLTCGIGMVTFVIPTIWIYATAAAPGALAGTLRAPWWVWVPAILLGLVTLAITPSWVSGSVAAFERARLTADDTTTTFAAKPRHLRIVHHARWSKLVDSPKSMPCEAECQTLLYGEEVDAIEVLAVSGKGETMSSVWTRQQQAVCPEAFERPGDALPYTARALAIGDCLIRTSGTTLPDAPWISFQPIVGKDQRAENLRPFWAPLTKLAYQRAGTATTPHDAPTHLRTMLTQKIMFSPTVIAPDSGGMNMALELYRVSQTTHESSLRQGLQTLFGYDVHDLPEPGPPTFADIDRLLDRPGTEPFSPTLQKLIDDTLRTADRPKAPLTEASRDTLYRLLADPRAYELFFAGRVLERNPTMIAGAMPALVTRIGMALPKEGVNPQRAVARLLIDQPNAMLLPYADALMQAVRNDTDNGTASLLALAPLLTDDVADLLATNLASDDDRRVRGAIAGVCNASTAEATPHLEGVLAQLKTRKDAPSLAIRTLVRHGWSAQVDAVLATWEERDRKRALSNVDRYARAEPVGGCRP